MLVSTAAGVLFGLICLLLCLFNEMLNVSDEESGCGKMDAVVIRTPSGPWEEASIAHHDIVTLEGARSLPRAGCREGQGAELG